MNTSPAFFQEFVKWFHDIETPGTAEKCSVTLTLALFFKALASEIRSVMAALPLNTSDDSNAESNLLLWGLIKHNLTL